MGEGFLMGGGCGGGAMKQALELRTEVFCWDWGWRAGPVDTYMVASIPLSEDWFISSMGDSSVGVAMMNWEKWLAVYESAIVGTKEPQNESGGNDDEESMSGEKQDVMACSENEVTLFECVDR